MNERSLWLAFSCIEGMGPISINRLHKHFGGLERAWSATVRELEEVEGFGQQTAELLVAARRTLSPTELLQQHEARNPQFWTPADADYPQLLLEIPDLPPVLYYHGIVNAAENQGTQPTVAIVGTRQPSNYGNRWTQRLTTALVEHGFTIVSGLASGIDTCAHQTCVAQFGRTIAVLGTGVDVVYPYSNRRLYQEVLKTGLVVSEYPAQTPPDRVHFPRRNRIIAGLSRAVIVMEAPQRSGALITAHLANEYGRDVYVLPGSLDNAQAIGCLGLVNSGAQVILSETHLLELLGSMPPLMQTTTPSSKPVQTALPLNLEPSLQQVLQVLTDLAIEKGSERIQFDWIVQKSGLSTGAVSGALLQLEMQDLVVSLPGMAYQRC